MINPSIYCIPGKALYAKIPANTIRNFVDNLFPNLAIDSIADSVSGVGHRFKAGHDLLLDVPKTFKLYGPKAGFHQMGHILLTDFPTKHGIPIPGFSKSGLGQLLYEHGIKMSSMCINLVDATAGILCLGEGTKDLVSAISGNMGMDFKTFLDTYVEGSVELTSGILGHNPMLVVSGSENIAAGIIATWKEITYTVNPSEFFCPAIVSIIVGYAVSRTIGRKEPYESIISALKSGLISGLYCMSPFFSLGSCFGFIFMELEKLKARKDSIEEDSLSRISLNAFKSYLQSLSKLDSNLFNNYFYKDYKKIIADNTSDYLELLIEDSSQIKNYKQLNEDSSFFTNNDFLIEYMQLKNILHYNNNEMISSIEKFPNLSKLDTNLDDSFYKDFKNLISDNSSLYLELINEYSLQTNNHKLYEGSEKPHYFCKYCGAKYPTIGMMTLNLCHKSPLGRHSPAL